MKLKLLAFALAFSGDIYAATCGRSSRADINKCEVDDLITQFADRNTCSFKKDLPYTYENLICDPLAPLSFFQSKLQEWKDEAVAVLVEQERISSIKLRLEALGIEFGAYNSIKGLRVYLVECGVIVTNDADWLIKNIYKKDDNYLECFESNKVKVATDKETTKTKDKAKNDAKNLLKDYDCGPEVGWSKIACEAFK